MVPKPVMNYYERAVDIPSVLQEETPVEKPTAMIIEAVTKVPRPQIEFIQKEFPVNQLQIQERIVEVPQYLKMEVPVEENIINYADIVTEVLKPEVQYVDKPVPRIE